MRFRLLASLFLLISIVTAGGAQHSVARQWNEKLLLSIRNDFARPTVHARNLFHISAAMYDAWAAYDNVADTYFLAKENHDFYIPFKLTHMPDDIMAAREKAISYAAYRLIKHRFQNAPAYDIIESEIDDLMNELGYSTGLTSSSYQCGAAELGNYIASQIIEYGLMDGSNEENDYVNQYYLPYNDPLLIEQSGASTNILDLNRWQPIEFLQFIDQAGNPIGQDSPEFLSAEWGNVLPFSMDVDSARTYFSARPSPVISGDPYNVYHDPGKPPNIEDGGLTGLDNLYKWGFSMVSLWSSHLDPSDTTMWDISPGSIGNISDFPSEFADYDQFYNYYEGGDKGEGHDRNPVTDSGYELNLVKRSDYARVLAEFWADGPDSETPPGHWFTIMNEVMDHPQFERRFLGQGDELDPLEWDVKSYFILGGAMHDAAIAAWSIKGWYDYIRPVSAIRGMGERGQASDPNLPSYNPEGLPLIPGYIELVESIDLLRDNFRPEDIDKIKIKAWRGPRYIGNPETQVSGVGWILADDWWPYQRPTFVTPPFAGYVSGHSTFSRAAAEVLTALTGDAFFPGGMGEFFCPKNEFLVFEEGPSDDITLQWATYRDASDQCSLSRIWGGIHPPADDIPGRLIGKKIGVAAFNYASAYFAKEATNVSSDQYNLYPNPTQCGVTISYSLSENLDLKVYQMDGKLVYDTSIVLEENSAYLNLGAIGLGVFVIVATDADGYVIINERVVVL